MSLISRQYIRKYDTGDWQANAEDISPDGTILESGPALVQSKIGLDIYKPNSAGNVYVCAVTNDGRMGMWWREPGGPWQLGETFGKDIPDTPPVMIEDFWDTKDEKAFGGFQLLVANKDGKAEHWQRINDDILDHPPKGWGKGQWKQVGTFGDGKIFHVWGLVQGSFNFALEAIVEDVYGDLWHWEYDGSWKQKKRLPDEMKLKSSWKA